MWSHWDASIISICGTMLTRRELLADFAAVSFFPLAKGESQTMDQRVSVATLGVKDLGSSKRFYVDGFGWKPVHEDNEIMFPYSGMVFALFCVIISPQISGGSGNIRICTHGIGIQRPCEK